MSYLFSFSSFLCISLLQNLKLHYHAEPPGLNCKDLIASSSSINCLIIPPSCTMAVNKDSHVNGAAKESTNGTDHKAKTKAGMISDVKNLYEGKPDSRGRSTWVDKYPKDIEEAAENAETARYALLIRNKKCYDGRKKLQMDSIIVQSPLLKLALGQILKDYPGITTTLDRLTFKAPFKPFVHRWSKLVAALKDEEDEETKQHLDLLHRTMEAELKDDLTARDDYILNKVITWDTAWMIFEPGTVVFGQDDKQDCAFRLKSGSYVEVGLPRAISPHFTILLAPRDMSLNSRLPRDWNADLGSCYRPDAVLPSHSHVRRWIGMARASASRQPNFSSTTFRAQLRSLDSRHSRLSIIVTWLRYRRSSLNEEGHLSVSRATIISTTRVLLLDRACGDLSSTM